jgi:predicted molibdopterin-dependent oxidoreductase YjgC
MKSDVVLTVCPFCGCGCQFYLHLMDGELAGVVPCRDDEVSGGKLCIKGRNAADFVRSPDRLTSPLVKKKGKLQPASWDEALELIAKRLGEVKQKHGADSIGVLASAKCTNEENFVLMKFARAVIGTNNVDHCARL